MWKARDTRLDRSVALKTLPAEKVADPERPEPLRVGSQGGLGAESLTLCMFYDIAGFGRHAVRDGICCR